MQKIRVVEYGAEWNPGSNAFAVGIRLETGHAQRLNVESMEEFVALLLLLSKSPVYLDPATGDLECGPRPVGT